MNSQEFGKKLVDKAIAGKTGHRIAIIGIEVFGAVSQETLNSENYTVELFKTDEFNRLNRLLNYTLCIVGYETFNNESQQINFYKQMLEATEHGVNFVFVYYKEIFDRNPNYSISSIGYQIADKLNLYPRNFDQVFHEADVKKQEFQPFLKKWGVTNLGFEPENDDAKPIYITEDINILGLSAPMRNAEIIFLPFIRNHSNINDWKDGLETLIDNVLTFLAKSRINLPVWAEESAFFSDEEKFLKEKTALQAEIVKLDAEIQKFDIAKSLLFHNEYHLEITLPNFLKTHLDLNIEQNETYKEDFWIVDEKGEKLAIAEIKSKTKGFTKGLVGYLIAHRDYYEFDDNFPTLLFVNCNLQAGSWKDKDKPLNDQEYRYVANQNILVIRVEDLVRLWEIKRVGKITGKEVLNLLITSKGWLQVTSKLEIKIHPSV